MCSDFVEASQGWLRAARGPSSQLCKLHLYLPERLPHTIAVALQFFSIALSALCLETAMDELVDVAQSPRSRRVRARVVSTASFLAAFCGRGQHAFSVAQQCVCVLRVETVARAARGTESRPGVDVGHRNSGSRALYGL